GEVRALEVERLGLTLDATGPDSVGAAVDKAVQVLLDRGALEPGNLTERSEQVVSHTPGGGPAIGVVVEPDREHVTRELLGAAARLARDLDGRVVALGSAPGEPGALGGYGAHAVMVLSAAT